MVAIVIVPVRPPTREGLKVTLRTQLVPGRSGVTVEQVPPPEKSPLKAKKFVKLRDAVPVLVMVIVLASLVFPVVTFPKLRVDGESKRVGVGAGDDVPSRFNVDALIEYEYFEAVPLLFIARTL